MSSSPKKSAQAFRTISEVAGELNLPQHVLRFWETKFTQVQPMKRGGGRRYYRPEDVLVLKRICTLLYDDGYTIKGVQKLLREGGVKALAIDATAASAPVGNAAPGGDDGAAPAPTSTASLSSTARMEIEAVLGELQDLRGILVGARG